MWVIFGEFISEIIKVFGVIVGTIVDHIFANPGILQEKILEHFVHRLVSPVSILELLDRLVKSEILRPGVQIPIPHFLNKSQSYIPDLKH